MHLELVTEGVYVMVKFQRTYTIKYLAMDLLMISNNQKISNYSLLLWINYYYYLKYFILKFMLKRVTLIQDAITQNVNIHLMKC